MHRENRRLVSLLRLCLLLSIWLLPFTIVVSADDLNQRDAQAEARRWVAAKFLGLDQWKSNEPGLTVLANYGPVQKNGRGEDKLNISGVRFDHGFYCHATSEIVVQLPAPGKTFTAQVGVDSNSQTRPERGSVVFGVQIGQQQSFRSATVREGMAAVPVTVDLDGATQFVLTVEDGGDGFSCDQADWADAQIVLANGETLWLDALPMVCLQRGPFTTEVPFSFRYGDKPSAELLPQWKVDRAMRKLDNHRTEHVVTCSDPETGLVVRCVAIEYLDFPTVEWTLFFKNTGKVDSPIVSDIQALDIRLQRGPGNEFVLHHQRGDSCTPDSFEPLTTTLAPNAELQFCAKWRPSDQWPVALLQHSLGSRGPDCRDRLARTMGGQLLS